MQISISSKDFNRYEHFKLSNTKIRSNNKKLRKDEKKRIQLTLDQEIQKNIQLKEYVLLLESQLKNGNCGQKPEQIKYEEINDETEGLIRQV